MYKHRTYHIPGLESVHSDLDKFELVTVNRPDSTTRSYAPRQDVGKDGGARGEPQIRHPSWGHSLLINHTATAQERRSMSIRSGEGVLILTLARLERVKAKECLEGSKIGVLNVGPGYRQRGWT